MNSSRKQTDLPRPVRRVLDAVRRRIRAYVWLEGLAMLVVFAGFAFWGAIALDWLFEPPANVRLAALVILAVVALYVAYRFLLRRIFVPISDRSAAVLLERRFPSLSDHVLTVADTATPAGQASFHPEMIRATRDAAERSVAGVDPNKVFNFLPLARAIGVATLLIISVTLFALLARDTFGFWLKRVALSEELWPRRVQLEVVSFPPDGAGRRAQKLAADDDFELLVHADVKDHELPDEVEIRFELADGRRGRDTLTRVGTPDAVRDGVQLFRYEFKRVTGDMRFDIVGGDDRVRDLHLQVVDRPELLSIEIECFYPQYLAREPRRLPVTGGMRIPEGARLVVHATSTKPLIEAALHTTREKRDAELQFAPTPQNKLRWEYGTLLADDALLIYVTDTDGVSTREPYRVSLAAVKDELPQVAVRLAGIGSAITPDAILPFAGKITDDYGLERAWFEYKIDDGPVATRPLSQSSPNALVYEKLDAFDTRQTEATTGKRTLELRPKQRLTLVLKAADRYDVPGIDGAQPDPRLRAGSSQSFALDVVTAADLMALLERRELALRQRFEAIFEKVTDTRNLMGRIDFDGGADADGSGPPAAANDEPSTDDSVADRATDALERSVARLRLRVSGSLQNIMQSKDEVAGIAEAFDDLGAELTNNRIDNPDLSSRLREQIAQPLHQIAGQRMPQLIAQLKLVEENLEDPSTASVELAGATTLADEILVEMRQVLDRMLELENYNEVVALLRGIIDDQKDINERTKQLQKERIRTLFDD